MTDINLNKLIDWIDTYNPSDYNPTSRKDRKIDIGGVTLRLGELSSAILVAAKEHKLSFDQIERAQHKLKQMSEKKQKIKKESPLFRTGRIATRVLPTRVSSKQAVKETSDYLQSVIQTQRKFSGEIERKLSSQLQPPDASATESSNESLAAQIKQISMVASKTLSVNQYQSIELKVGDLHIIVMKDKNDQIELLVKDRLIGSGQSGDAYVAKMVGEKQELALKYGKVGEADKDLENEVEILNVLNTGKYHEGIQRSITVSDMRVYTQSKPEGLFGGAPEATSIKVTRGAVYSRGDFQNQVEVKRMANLLGVTKEELLGMDKDVLRAKVQEKLGDVNARLKAVLNETEDPDVLLERLDKEVWPFVADLETSVQVLLDKELLKHFDVIKSVTKASLTYDKANVLEQLKDTDFNQLFTNLMLESAEKCAKQPKVSNESLLIYSSNLVAGLIHMHSCEVIHGDIKPRNFFWNESMAVVADYGGAQKKGVKYDAALQTTPGYASIEYLDAIRRYKRAGDVENQFRAGQALDIRALGMSIFEMYTGGMPDTDGIEGDETKLAALMSTLQENGMPEEAARIVVKMVTPTVTPEGSPYFNLPAEVEELTKLQGLLSGQILISEDTGNSVGGFISGLG